MAIERTSFKPGKGFDPNNAKHIAAAVAQFAEAVGDQAGGWRYQSYDPSTGELTVVRQSAVTIVGGGDKGSSYEVGLGQGIKTSDADRVAAELESDPRHQGYYMTRFDPHLGTARLTKMRLDEVRARTAVANALGVKNWEVQVKRTSAGGFQVQLPGAYTPSKHDEKMQEVAEILGKVGWYWTASPRELKGEIIPSEPPMFPKSYPYPLDMLPTPVDGKLAPIPVGMVLSERGDQANTPLFLDFSAAPHLQVGGITGAGKAQGLDTLIPTPSGWTTMGEIQVGDEVLGRDGKACRVVFASDVNENPDLYRITFSDGQTIDADADHQWVASDFAGRNAHNNQHHKVAIANQEQCRRAVDALRELAAAHAGETLTLQELLTIVAPIPGIRWTLTESVRSVLSFMEVPIVQESRQIIRPGRAAFTRNEPLSGFPARALLSALADDWERPLAARGNGVRRLQAKNVRAATVARSLALLDLPDEMSVKEIGTALREQGAEFSDQAIANTVKRVGIDPVRGYREVKYPAGRDHQMNVAVNGYDARHALNALAARMEFLNGEDLRISAEERVVTTAEMLAEGVEDCRGGSNWAVRITAPLELPEADLPVGPYTMGAWLGDGSSYDLSVVSMDPEIIENIHADGYPTRKTAEDSRGGRATIHFFDGILADMKRTGLIREKGKFDKRIPATYLRASYDQRLAVLQGLMDTDGTISKRGGCELSLNKRDLAEDAIELIRSLGIKASWSGGESAYVTDDGVRKVTGTRYRIKFTTDKPVFRLPRKLERLPKTLRETSNWLYVEAIEKIAPRPARCIQVTSPDATYLCAGFVPTHNTVTLNNVIAGALAGGAELVIIDVPQKAVDFESWRPFVRRGGWGCESYEENAVTLEELYKEGERRAALFKQYGAKKLAEMPADIRATMKEVVIVVDEVTGLFAMDSVPKRLEPDDPLRVEAESRNYARELIKTFIEKIAAEQRFVGYHLVLSTQVASTATGIGTALRTNLPLKILLGARATDGNRKLILTDVTAVPNVPDHIKADGDASLGVGVFELTGQTPGVFKSFFASEEDLQRALRAHHINPLPETQLDSTRPDPKGVASRFPEAAMLADAKREAAAPKYGTEKRTPEAWELDEDGKPLTGFAKANAARHHATVAAGKDPQ